MNKDHNYFFYFKQEMPWKVPYAVQDQRELSSGEEGQEVDGAEEAQDEAGSDSASEGA